MQIVAGSDGAADAKVQNGSCPSEPPLNAFQRLSMQIVAASDVAAGAEVRNCYGELSNCELVVKYGFALEAGNPFDTVSLLPNELTAAAQRHLGKAAAKKRVAFLNSHRCLPDPSAFVWSLPRDA